jgi:hypothetical protein
MTLQVFLKLLKSASSEVPKSASHDLYRIGVLREATPERLNRPVGMETMYFAHISLVRPVKSGRPPGSIGVLEALDKYMPIGVASCRG